MKKQMTGIVLITTVISLAVSEAKAATTNSFTPSTRSWLLTPSTDGWVVDRYAPHSFSVTNVQGKSALQIGIDPAESLANRPAPYQSAFYNTQGFQRPSGLESNEWSASASLFISTDMTNGTASPFRSDLWLRTGITNDESVSQYFIIGLFSGDTNNRANPTPTTVTTSWEVWDDVNGVWIYLPQPVTNGWNDVRVAVAGGSAQYFIGTNLVYTETNIAFPAHLDELTSVFLEAYNFGDIAYTAFWGNDWSIDRYPPHSVSVTNVAGRLAIELGIDPADSLVNRPAPFQSTFYNTQGFQIPAGVNTNDHWAAFGSLYVPANIANGSAAPFRSDMWARTGPTGSEDLADYFIIGLFAGDVGDRANPNPTSVTVVWNVWDDSNGVWIYLPRQVTAGWHDLRISYDNGAIYYYIDSELAYTYTSITHPENAVSLSTIFIEAYNFGNNAYSTAWSNIGDTDASVPFLPTLLTITLSGQPGFVFDLQATASIAPAEIWTPVASARNTTGSLMYRTSSFQAEKQFFRAVSKP